MKLFDKNKRGVISIYIVFLMVVIVVIFIGAFFAPIGTLLNTELYAAGEMVMLQANDSVSQIQNDTVRNSIELAIGQGLAAQENNVEVNTAIFQYSWVFVVLISGLVLFIFSRRIIEYGGQGGGGFI